MEMRYDERADAAAVDLHGRIAPGSVDFTDELDQDRNVLYDANDRVLGYRFLNVRRYGVKLDDLEHRDALRALFLEAEFVERDWGTPPEAGRRLDAPPPKTQAIVERWRRSRQGATPQTSG